jgi:hypothetical protein
VPQGSARLASWAAPPLAGAVLLLSGCSSTQDADVAEVAATFADGSVDPAARCDLLAPATLTALEESAAVPCSQAIEEVSTDAGEVQSVEVWGGNAQVKLTGDTLFLAETGAGWRISAAACREQAEAPYDCEVDGP